MCNDIDMSKGQMRPEEGSVLHALRERIARLEAENYRLQANEKLVREQAQQQQSILDAIPNPVFFKDTSGRYTGCNAAFVAPMKVGPEEVIGKTAHDLTSPDVADRTQQAEAELLRDGGRSTCEIRHVYEDGTVVELMITKVAFADADGKIAGLVGVATDITEQKAVERALKQDSALLDQIIDLNPYAIEIFDVQGHLVRGNQAAAKLYGPPPPDGWCRFEDPILAQWKLLDLVREVKQGKTVRVPEFWYNPSYLSPEHPDISRCLRMVLFPTTDDSGRIENIVAMVADVTERRVAEDALRESEDKYRTLVENAGDTICVVDENGTYLFVNATGAHQLEMRPDEVVGKNLADFFPPELAARHLDAVREVIRTGEGTLTESRTQVRGVARWYNARIQPLRDSSGKAVSALVMLRDITEHKDAEEALRESERAERRFREMLTALHEVGNELTKIESFDEFCRQAVVLGRERLGFDRLGLWFLGDEPNTIRGSFGTDERGVLRDERTLEIEATVQSDLGQVLNRELPLFVEENAELHDADENVIARGPKVIAPLSDGDDVIGCLATDNLLRGGAIGPYERELLRLYAATLGHLCSRKRADEALRQSEEKYRALTENTNDMVYSADADGILTYVGPQIARYGRTPQEVLSHNLLEFVVPEDRDQVATDFRKSISTGLEFPSQFRIQGEDGAVRWVEDWGKVQRDETGTIVGMTGVLRDITERKQAEKDLREARRKLTVAREAEGRRLAREVHDSLGQQLIGLQLGLEGVTADLAGTISNKARYSLRHLAEGFGELIREVRTISHGLYPPTLESFGLTAALTQLARSYAPSTEIDVKHPRTLTEVRFAPEVEIAIFRIAQEAVNNAVRHSQAETIIIGLKQRKGEVVLTVTDDGSGFDTAAATGNGLGLTAMTERADAVGGRVHIESKPGRTRVRVNVPLA